MTHVFDPKMPYMTKTRLAYISFIMVALILLYPMMVQSQVHVRDERGDSLPTPSWPPPDSLLYSHSTITIWFSPESINQQFLCNYWEPPSSISQSSLSLPTGEMPISSAIIINPALLATLQSFGAVRMWQYTSLSPCRDSLSITRYGDTILTPKFWNCYTVEIGSGQAITAVTLLNYLYAGRGIDYAELIFKSENLATPIEFVPAIQMNFQNATYGINMVNATALPGAWDIQTGNRHIKLAIVDDGFYYPHPDLGGGVGGTNRFVAIRQYRLGTPFDYRQGGMLLPGSGNGDHGTRVSGHVAAMNNNGIGVTSVAGGFTLGDGLSFYGMKCMWLNPPTDIHLDPDGSKRQNDLVSAWVDAAAATTGGNGFGVHIISNSNGNKAYVETRRRALDYAYRMGVVCVSGKGNDYRDIYVGPGSFDYHKIIAVGASGASLNPDIDQLVPIRQNYSNWGYGLDVMAPASDYQYTTRPPFSTETLIDPTKGVGAPTWQHGTSAATPQVAGIAGLLLSQLSSGVHANIVTPLEPEDIEGLISVTASDINFPLVNQDTVGYDEITGYGLVKADAALQALFNPYVLYHYTATGGTDVDSVLVDPFIVIAPSDGTPPLLAPSSATTQYKAMRHSIRKTINLSGWRLARSWGRGRGSNGWSGAQPLTPNSNPTLTGTPADNYQTGYTRVIGDGNPNTHNIRDISWQTDAITLEAFCYTVYNKATNAFIGWYPTTPDKVRYKYTIWGLDATSNAELSIPPTSNSSITVRCEPIFRGDYSRVALYYTMAEPSPVEIVIYDPLGRTIAHHSQPLWSSTNEQRILLNLESIATGFYTVIVRSKNAIGNARFANLK